MGWAHAYNNFPWPTAASRNR